MLKKTIIILSVIIVLLFIPIIIMNINTNNTDSTEQDGYIKLKEIAVNELEKNGIVKKIDLIDNILLTEFDNQKGINDQFIIDVCLKYILANYDNFENKIVYLDKTFIYEEEGTEYLTNYYIDKVDIQSIVNTLFYNETIDITKSNYYDNSTAFLAMISKGSDEIRYSNKEFSKIEKTSENDYLVEVKYIIDEQTSFEIQYDIVGSNSEFVIKDINIIK